MSTEERFTCDDCHEGYDTRGELDSHECVNFPHGEGTAKQDPDKIDTDETSGRITEQDEDELIRRASVPNLAALFKQGKDSGLIQAGKDYGN